MSKAAARERPSHRCGECGTTVGKWLGRCPECQAWGSITEVGGTRMRVAAGPVSAPARRITEVSAADAKSRPTGVSELDRVLGGGLVPGSVVLLAGEPGVGKALALGTVLVTSAGATTMGEVLVGDVLFAADGRPTNVVAVGPVLEDRPCFEITFCDGTRIVADAQHEWVTDTRPERLRPPPASVRTTREIWETVRQGTDTRANHSIAVTAALTLHESELPIPAYTLGAWLGDGASGGAVLADPLPGRLRALGLLGNEHIPMAYLRACEAQRRALLAGLLDTGGCATKTGATQIGLTNEQLARDTYDLIVGLGYRAQRTQTRVKGRAVASSTRYLTSFTTTDPVFRLPRKLVRPGATATRRYITDVRPVESVPVRCIQVDNSAGLYLASESMIPTHNSTLLLDTASKAAREGSPTLYVTGEESAAQVRLRAGRTGALNEHLWVAAETDLSAVLAHIDAVQPGLIIVDSVQTVGSADVEGSAGGVTQIRAVAAALIAVAKQRGIATVLVGHVTKDGSIAGPRLLEHLVDVVLHFEGDRHSTLRMVRAVKNRFGAADEIGCFQMSDSGIKGLADPSGLFLSRGENPVPGTCVTVTVEGRRPLLAEVQALVSTASREGSPKRAVSGLDPGRVSMVLAVAEKVAGTAELAKSDVHTATVGGIRVTDPGADLALLLAVRSACRSQVVPGGLVAIGEVGLSGEVRPVTGVQRRLAEAARLGFTAAIVPMGSGRSPEGIKVLEVVDVDTALRAVGALAGRARRTLRLL